MPFIWERKCDDMIHPTRKDCCACTACASACPKSAITMVPDENGFVYPSVDESKCVSCGLCEQVCAYQKMPPVSEKEVYAAVSGCTDVRESASGGLFAAFAQAVLEQGGAVYGCAMLCEKGQLWPWHVCVTKSQDLIRLKGSKYVQSDLTGIYPDVRRRLEAGQTVLFSGTPCQVAGLKGFLRREYENLFTVDIICHGVPGGELFRKYIAFEEQKQGAKITSFRFRDKSQGWKLHGTMTLDNGKTVYFEPEESSYYQMFLNSYTYRENCYTCPYASDRRPGDVTVGDYWCIDLVHPELLRENGGPLDHESGTSCLIVNSERGRLLLERFGGGIRRWDSTYENASKYNRQLTAPSVLKPERDQVLAMAKEDYAVLDAWYQRRLRKIKMKRAARAAIPKPLKKLIRSVIGKK